MPARREPVFTTVGLTFALTAAGAGLTSQLHQDLSAALETRLAAVPRNYTAMRVWISGLYTTTQIVSTAVLAEYSIGVGVYSQLLSNAEFPDIETHEGSWMLHDARRLIDQNAGTVLTPLEPTAPAGGSQVQINTRSARKLDKTTERLFMVI